MAKPITIRTVVANVLYKITKCDREPHLVGGLIVFALSQGNGAIPRMYCRAAILLNRLHKGKGAGFFGFNLRTKCETLMSCEFEIVCDMRVS